MQESKLKKNFLAVIVLTLSGATIYMLPYFRYYYYDAFKAAFDMTNTEMGLCGTYYGLFGMVSYLIGGVIADKISIKKLIPFSMIVTGALGLVLLMKPAPIVIELIHGIWGLTSLMTFWPALLKALRALANEDEQAKTFGIFEGGRGITNAATLAIAVALFAYFGKVATDAAGVNAIIIFYSATPIILGLMTIFLLRGIDESGSEDASSRFSLATVGAVIKNPALWLMSGIIFCTYMINMSYYYIAPYATAFFGASMVFAAIISSSSQYIRPFAAIGGGILGDKINSSKVMLIAEILTLVGMSAIMFTPKGTSIVMILIGCVFVYFSMYMTQSMHFAIMEEVNFPKEVTGTVIGILCCLGYLPEAISPYMAGVFLDNYGEYTGARLIFTVMIATTVIGIALTLIWLKRTKERRAEILALSKSK